MKKLLSIAVLVIGFCASTSAKGYTGFNFQQDTVVNDAKENQVIDEVVKTGKIPPKDKVQYFSQVTKYGFKNLFRNFSYNPMIPYSSQVDPHAETYMQDYLRAHGSYLQKLRATAVPYFNFIDNILAQYGLPKELKYLAVIESNLNSQALSWVGARGPWQFMPYTAKDYGLQVNSYLDERTDYFKSTHAAARYLLSLYKDLKDWLLVIAAYNGGPGRVYSAIQKSGSRNFWALQYYLPTESRNHVKKFIATHYIMEAAGNDVNAPALQGEDFTALSTTGGPSIGARPVLSAEEASNTEVMNISGKYNSVVLAKAIMMDMGSFNRSNPGFDNLLSSGESYELRLPTGKMDLFVANRYAILNDSIQLLLSDVNGESKTVYPTRKGISTKKKHR